MLVVEEAYPSGVPQTAVAGWSPKGVPWHWTAGGSGRAGWEGTVAHLIATRNTISASYHAGFWCEHGPAHVGCRTVLQWIVRSTVAAHSIAPSQVFRLNPNKGAALQEARFAEVRRILQRDNDPNADSLAIAYAGMPADLAADLTCLEFRADLQHLAQQLVGHPATDERPHFGHGWIQPISRYEVDEVGLDFIALLYGEAVLQEDDMRLLPSAQTLMTGRLREATGVAKLPLFDAELLASLEAGTWLGIVHRMPDQGGYTIDGVDGNDWLAVAIGDEVGYVEEPYVVDRHISDAGALVVPQSPAGLDPEEVKRIQASAREAGLIEGRAIAAAAAAEATLPT